MDKSIVIGKNECILNDNKLVCNKLLEKGNYHLTQYNILRKNFLAHMPKEMKITWNKKTPCGDEIIFSNNGDPLVLATYRQDEFIPTSICKRQSRWVTEIKGDTVKEYKHIMPYCATLRECKKDVLAYTNNGANQILALQWLKELKK